MNKDWQYLTKLTGDKPLRIERVVLENEEVAIEGRFELPPMAKLSAEDQVFVAVFVKTHGSIKQMEKHFGISYPTVKARLNRIGEKLGFVEVEASADSTNILERLRQGEITADEAINLMNKENKDVRRT